MANSKLKISLIQILSTANKTETVQHAVELIRKAVAEKSPKLVVLPECWNSPYSSDHFPLNAEYIPAGETSVALSSLAKELKIYIVGGSIPEIDANNPKILYNTITVWSPTGELIAKHSKVHLADVQIGELTLLESEKLSPGGTLNTFEIDGIKFGLGICYDKFFPELPTIYRQILGCDMLLFPSAYSVLAGETFWHLLIRARAADNQIFTAGISQARDDKAIYTSYGHSLISNPWGKVIAEAGSDEEIVHAEIDFSQNKEAQGQIPILKHKRNDIYETVYKGGK